MRNNKILLFLITFMLIEFSSSNFFIDQNLTIDPNSIGQFFNNSFYVRFQDLNTKSFISYYPSG